MKKARRKRVPSRTAARLIDEMLSSLAPCSTARLYRTLARELGMHHVTILRYHQRRLSTIRPDRLAALRELHSKALSGDLLLDDPPTRAVVIPRQKEERVYTSTLQPLFDRLRDRLQLTEYSVLYRCLSEQTGLSISSLRRFHKGTQTTAPRRLEFALQRLLSDCRASRFPPLTRSSGGEEVVPRKVYCAAIDRLADFGRFRSMAELFRNLGSAIQEPPDRLRRPYYNRQIQLVPRTFCTGARRLVEKMEYDPAKTFTMGERINHRGYGPGVVRGKRPRNVVLVEFEGGREVLLREGFQHDPNWARNAQEAW